MRRREMLLELLLRHLNSTCASVVALHIGGQSRVLGIYSNRSLSVKAGVVIW